MGTKEGGENDDKLSELERIAASPATSGAPISISQINYKMPTSMIGLEKYLKIKSPIMLSGDPNIKIDPKAFALSLEEEYLKIKNNRPWYNNMLNTFLTPVKYCWQLIFGVEKKYTDLTEEENNQLYNQMAQWSSNRAQ